MPNILEVQHCDFVFGNRTFLHELYCLKFLCFVENSNSLSCSLVDRNYFAKNVACLSKFLKITFKDHFEFKIQFQLYNNCLLIFLLILYKSLCLFSYKFKDVMLMFVYDPGGTFPTQRHRLRIQLWTCYGHKPYKIKGEYNVSATFNVTDLSPFDFTDYD